MTTMPVEIFSDHIDDNEETAECNKSLSKMNKSELYQLCKKLVNENTKLQLFVNTSDELHKQNENIKLDMSKKIKELEKDNMENVERIEFLEKQYMKLKKEINNLEKNNQELKELGYKMDEKLEKETHRLVGEDLLENIINLEKENKDLKEKDKKAKEIFKLMGEWYEDNIIGHLPESEDEDEEENE